jgi:hypothetical protein
MTILPPRLAGLLAMGLGKPSRHPDAHANGQRADDTRERRGGQGPAPRLVQSLRSPKRARPSRPGPLVWPRDDCARMASTAGLLEVREPGCRYGGEWGEAAAARTRLGKAF